MIIQHMESLFAGLDTSVCDLQTRKSIVIGSVGSGKTSLCKYVAGDYYDKSEDSKLCGLSVTKGVKTYRGKYIGTPTTQVQYTMVDSEGYGADSYSSDNLKNQLINALKFETELNCVIIVVSFERFRNGLKSDLSHLLGVIKTLGLEKEHILVVFTHCEIYKLELREKYIKEFKEYYAFDFGNDYVFSCFANMNEVNDDYTQIIAKNVVSSISEVRRKITEKNTVINVAIKIAEMSDD